MQKDLVCPICGCTEFSLFLKTKDHLITQEEFDIVSCNKCELKITSPKPELSQLDRYYKSENYITHNTEKINIRTILYKIARKIFVRKKIKIIKKHKQINTQSTPQLLDVGCGTGYFLSKAKKAGFECTGFEPLDDIRLECQKINPDLKIYNQNEFNNSTKKFDVITLWHVLEHLYFLAEELSKIVSLLKTNGTLIIAVPNYKSYDAKHYSSYWVAYDVPRHLYHFAESDIKNIAQKYNLIIEKIYPMKFDAYYSSLFSERYKRGNPFSFIKHGLKSNILASKKHSDYGYSSQIYVLKKQN